MQCTGIVQQNRFYHRGRDCLVQKGCCTQQIDKNKSKNYNQKFKIQQGEICVRAMNMDDFRGVSLLLTKAFAGTTLAASLKSIKDYITRLLSMPFEDGIVLVGRLSTDSQDRNDENNGKEGKEVRSRLITVVTLSFNENNREEFKSLKPDKDSAYLSNMAVDRQFRRQGVAQFMLEVCEEVVKIRGKNKIQLHVLSNDPGAQALYLKCGYQELERDGMLQRLQGQTPKILMQKELLL
eukprot:TRINITY_DN3664_c0_g2_i1.p1 TRINITY_DN3664_c0_g2~~TRINITY_DN3664_c0_g2_i1.p1  ORF type:complete len:256 (+),score=29.19 TRINITY_DN3664_c0_g2_i1:59-769(+)